MKPMGDPKSYQPIFLLCVPYKILERLIYARVESIIDTLLPKVQAGFRRGKLTLNQVVLFTQNMGDSFEDKKKAGGVLVNLTEAYGTVWQLQATRTFIQAHGQNNYETCPKSTFHLYYR